MNFTNLFDCDDSKNNRNILECKSETLEDVDKKADGNNRNILECKYYIGLFALRGCARNNRNILECKFLSSVT